MHGTDQIIPWMPCGQVADPFLVAGDIIDFESKADCQPGDFMPGVENLIHVFIQLVQPHTPVVEVVLRHGGVIGEPDLGQSRSQSPPCVVHRFALCVAAERRVHVQVGRQTHGHDFPVLAPAWQVQSLSQQNRRRYWTFFSLVFPCPALLLGGGAGVVI